MGALKIVEACRRTSGGDLTGRFPIGAVHRAAQGAQGRDFGSAVGAPNGCKIGAFVPGT